MVTVIIIAILVSLGIVAFGLNTKNVALGYFSLRAAIVVATLIMAIPCLTQRTMAIRDADYIGKAQTETRICDVYMKDGQYFILDIDCWDMTKMVYQNYDINCHIEVVDDCTCDCEQKVAITIEK